MTTQQMSCFVALYNSKSFTKAADILFMTQPAVSKNIASLEEELAVTLVERKKGGRIRITQQGEAYFSSFNIILKKLEETEIQIKYILSDTKQIFKVGTMETWAIPDLIRMCNNELPEELKSIEFIFEPLSPSSLNNYIKNEQLDFVFTIDPAFDHNKNYNKEYLTNIHTTIYTSVNNPAVENNQLSIKSLEPCLYVISEQQLTPIHLHQLNDLFFPRKLSIKEVHSGLAAFINVSSGFGASVSDCWSFNMYSDKTVSKILENTVLPVIFAKRSMDDPFYHSVSDYLLEKIKKWISLKEEQF